jgi:ABC-type Fe3+ transport system permease subunit
MSGGSSSASDWIPDMPDVDLDLDDGCFWIIIPVAAIVGVVIAMFYVVYIAPVFLAEILVDALLVAGLYKRLKGVEPRHWLRSAVGRTLLPALVATALFVAAGYLMARVAPEAHSIGEFWQQVSTGKIAR